MIGTAGSAEKAALARQAGADEVILYQDEDFEAAVKRLTDGKGVNVVYDGVGKDTFDGSLNCLKPRGMLALFGAASGPVPPLDPQILNAKGSLFLTRPSLGHYVATRQELLQRVRRRARLDRSRVSSSSGRARLPARPGRRGPDRAGRPPDRTGKVDSVDSVVNATGCKRRYSISRVDAGRICAPNQPVWWARRL